MNSWIEKRGREIKKRMATFCCICRYHFGKRLGTTLPLGTIADYHASDKGTLHGYNSPFNSGHGYAEYYHRLFSEVRHQELVLLEIGIGVEGPGAFGTTVFGRNKGGASLKTWRDFFPSALIYGIDINESSWLDGDRVKTMVGDQGDRESLESALSSLRSPPTIVIDDGSHASADQQLALLVLFPHLTRGGKYVIEDLQWQPTDLEKKSGAELTRNVMRRFIETGKFDSINVSCSPDSITYLEENVIHCDLIDFDGVTKLAVLTKR